MIAYKIEGIRAVVEKILFVPIEFLDWNCLTIGALGWGQVQIVSSNRITVNHDYSRKKWMIELCNRLAQFYPKEKAKIAKRIAHFQKLRTQWEQSAE